MKRTYRPVQNPPGFTGQSYRSGALLVMISQDMGRWHLSISSKGRNPSWQELHDVRYDLVPDDALMALLLPPRREYVNLHAHCFHLWQVTTSEAGPA